MQDALMHGKTGANPPDLASLFESEKDPATLFAARVAGADATITAALASSFPPQMAQIVSVAAVGGYGRKELFPHSDIDLLVLTAAETDFPLIKGALANFLSSLWDKGLRISHSTRTVADCCRLHPENTELHISLLDRRYLTGNSEIYRQLQSRLPEMFRRHGPAIVSRLVELTRQRHAKFNNTPYHLEPNIKEAPGGIRDIHLLRWLAQLQPEEAFLRETMIGLERGRAEPEEVRLSELPEQQRAKEFLFSLRCFLHLHTGRDSNLLTFELQDEAARLLPPQPMPPEEWMRMYFHDARRIYQRSLRALEFAEPQDLSFLAQFRDWKNKIASPDFSILRNRVYLRRPVEHLRSGPEILRLFSFVGKYGIQLSWEAHWAVQRDIEAISEAFRTSPPGWEDWRALFSQPHTGLALSEMQETGVLIAALPQWSSIDSLVVRDFYHRYTVDEHTLIAIGEIDRLAASPDDAGRFERLAREDRPSFELRLALLLHDIGKGTTPGDHLRGSRLVAREVMDAMKVPEAHQEIVQFLIRQHLALSTLMNGRDLEDPATARLLTSEIHTIEHLRRLTLLTFADISAVNPTAMSPWRLEQLWRVYALGVEQLTRELASDRIHESPGGFQEGRSQRLIQYLDGFPKRYVRTHSREEIEHHLQLAGEARREGFAVEITEESGGVYLMTVLTYDKSGLFASLCGTLASFGMNIVKGEASSNSSKVVLDLIRFTDPNRTLELNPEEKGRLQATVRDVITGSVDVGSLLRKRRPLRRPTSEATIVPTVRFIDGASDEATLIDFVGEDRPGLLYDLATAISAAECNIEVVMIDTEALKAIDVFYVTHRGGKLDHAVQQQLKAGLLSATGFENLQTPP